MKTTKVIAVVLSLMMILGTMPMMASATANIKLADAIADVMGMPSAEIITSHVNWGVTNLDFTDEAVASKTGITVGDGITFDSESGAVFPTGDTNAAINYTNIGENKDVTLAGWGPLSCSDYLHIAFKLDEGGSLTFRGENTYRGNEFFVQIIPNGYTQAGAEGEEATVVPAVNVYSATAEGTGPNYVVETSGYNPGTEWNDLLVKKDNPGATSGGYSVYMKKASDAQFTLVATAPFFQAGTGLWAEGALTISGRNASVREANNYIGSNIKYFDSITEIMGITEGKAELQLTPNYNFTQEGFAPDSEVKYLSDDNYDGVPVYTPGVGLTMDGEKNSYWYAEYASNPLVAGTATVFAMQHTAETDKTMININTPDGGCTYATITKDKLYSNTSTGNPADFAFGTDPFELLYLAKEEGYAFYARNASANNRWVELTNVSESRTSSLSRGSFSISTSGATDGVVVSSIKMYGTDKVFYDSVEEMMNVEEASNWFYSEKYTGTTKPEEATVTGSVNYTADGIVFPAGAAATAMFTPATDHWLDVNTTVIKGKFGNGASTEKMFILANTPNASGRHYLTLFPTYLTTNTSSGKAEFDFGTDWFELAIFSYEGGHKIFVKNQKTDGKWQFLIENTNRDGSATYFSIQSYATNTGDFTLQSMDVYKAEKTYDSIEEIMGITEGKAELQFKPNYDFTVEGFTPGSEVKYLSNDSYDGVPVYTPGVGLTIDGEKNSYWYAQYDSNPLVAGTATVFAMKHTAETDKTLININTPDGGCTYATIVADKITSNTSTGNPASFTFGTDPFELLYLAKAEGYAFYARNASTNNRWVELTNVSESRKSSFSSGAFSIATVGATDGVVISSIKMYGTDKVFYDSIEEMMGGDLTTTYAFDFDSDYDENIMANSSASMTTGLDCSDEYGLDLTDGAWSFNAYKTKNWSPLNGNLPGDTYVPQALYFKMKFHAENGETTVSAGTPNADGRLYRGLKVGSELVGNGATVISTRNVFIDTNLMEHLIVPASTETGGYSHYVKSATQTNNKWIKALETADYRDAGTEYTGVGISFTQAELSIYSIRTYQLAIDEADARPEDATLLYYQENMDAQPAYANLTLSNGNFETEGVASFPAVDNASYGKYVLNYAQIPVGGYAEFKTRSNGTVIMNVTDGAKSLTLNMFKPYTGIEGGSGVSYMFGETQNLWRIWRVLRTENGYTLYVKLDENQGFLKVFENEGVDAEGNAEPRISFTFRNHSDGESVGSGQLDYLKIYGPARADKLIVTDGYGTKEFQNGDTIGYGSALRPIVQTESGTFLVVTYVDNRVVKATIKDVSELTGHDLISVVSGGADTVKVFLWDSLAGNTVSLTEGLTLVYPAPKTEE